jgi:hypothetical protein
MKKDEYTQIKHVFENARQKMISLIDNNMSPDDNHRCTTLNSNILATILAHAACNKASKKTRVWLESHARGMDIAGFPWFFSESSPLMHACFTIVEKICGYSLPQKLKRNLPSLDEVTKQLNYPCSHNSSYILSLHLACVALFCTIKEVKVPDILDMISDLQQADGSWTDDVIITALSTLALQKGGLTPKYDVQKWLKHAQLPDGSWAAANGEVWEASYALRTGQYPHTTKLTTLLMKCMHPNNWWGYSRYAVPDVDDTAVACCALAPYIPQVTLKTCEKLIDVQHESGGWGAFPQIERVVPHESVVGKPRSLANDITCHVLEALEQNNRHRDPSFKKGISYLLETQEQNGCWRTTWWNSNIYATAEIALLLHRNGHTDAALHAMDWLEKQHNKQLNTVECALLIKTFSGFSDYFENLNWAVSQFLAQYSLKLPVSTFDSVYFCGLIDCKIYNLSLVIYALYNYLNQDGIFAKL